MSRRITLIITVILLAIALAVWQWHRSQNIATAQSQPSESTRNLAATRPATHTSGNSRVTSGKNSPVTGTASIEDFMKNRFGGNWNATRDENGKVTSLSGGLISGLGANFEKAKELAVDIAQALGYPANQLFGRPVKEDSTELSKSFRFSQTYEGFEVYGGSVAILARKEDGAVYLINNELKVVDSLNTQARVSADAAKAIVAAKYSAPGTTIKLARPDTVIWAEQIPNELAWIFAVDVTAPTQNTYQVIVGAESGQILQDKSTLRN